MIDYLDPGVKEMYVKTLDYNLYAGEFLDEKDFDVVRSLFVMHCR